MSKKVSGGRVSKKDGTWRFNVRVNGKRARQSGFATKAEAVAAMEDVKKGASVVKYATKKAADKFWTSKRLLVMRDKILPESHTIQDAITTASEKWKKAINQTYFRKVFLEQFGNEPKYYVGLNVGSVDNPYIDLPPPSNPIYLSQKLEQLEKDLKRARSDLFKARRLSDMIKYELRGFVNVPLEPDSWVVEPPKLSKYHHGMPVLFLSDIHYGETVKADQIGGVNFYNLAEADRRLERFFTKAASLVDYSFAPADYPGIVCAMGGDMFSGLIHEELRETNELPTFPCIIQLVERLASGIKLLKERFKKVFVPIVVGNHGRIDKKMRCKDGPQENYEYIMGHMLALHFKDDPDVTIVVSEGFEYLFSIAGLRMLLLHGDQFRGGTGISGPILPWSLGEHRKRKQRQSMESWTGKPCVHDYMMFGHWHTTFDSKTFLSNGSGKGFDEYAMKMGFSFEPPQQLFWFVHPQYGVIHVNSIYGTSKGKAAEKPWITILDN